MAKLALDQAPVVSLPRRFLLSMPPWGMLAGVLLLVDGDALLRSRWHPGTLALVHAYTLGVLGNAMFGSLLQFLPAAAGVRLRGVRLGAYLHGLFNAGALALVFGLRQGSHVALLAAALALPTAFAMLAGMTVPGLLQASLQRLLRAGIGMSLAFGSIVGLLGATLALARAGYFPIRLPALVDVHASWGIAGWVLLLLVSVSGVVMPMFQGTRVPSARHLATWLVALPLLLSAAAAWRLGRDDAGGMCVVLASCALAFGVGVLGLQRRTPSSRRGPLWWSWRGGAAALVLSALAFGVGNRYQMGAAVLALGGALPVLVVGMALEIVAFLGWIDLHRRVGRGVQLPGVQRLMPSRDRSAGLLALAAAALLLVAATLYPVAWLARAAGLALCAAWLVVGLMFIGVRWRTRRFLITAGVRT